MNSKRVRWFLCALAALAGLAALVALADEYDLPPGRPTAEFHFARLAYPEHYSGYGGYGRDSWIIDSPYAETHLLKGISRLTRVDASPDAVGIDLEDDSLFDYPWLYAVEVGHWYLDDEHAARLREYLLRGGFLMVDDFHGPYEWAVFLDSMMRVFPDRPIIDIPENDEVFHVIYDLNERVQIPGIAALMRGVTYEHGGVTPHWRGIYDDEGRLMVAINHNMDMGDAWELADNPRYPEQMTALAYRFAGNYVVYAMTH